MIVPEWKRKKYRTKAERFMKVAKGLWKLQKGYGIGILKTRNLMYCLAN